MKWVNLFIRYDNDNDVNISAFAQMLGVCTFPCGIFCLCSGQVFFSEFMNLHADRHKMYDTIKISTSQNSSLQKLYIKYNINMYKIEIDYRLLIDYV